MSAAYSAARVVANSVYLNVRGILPATPTDRRFKGTWREDARGNVIFPHFDAQGPCGYEIKNAGWTGFAAGGTRAAWQSQLRDTDRRLVLTESAIDALSYHQIKPDPHTHYLSTGGALGNRQREVVRDAIVAMAPGAVVVLAFDADAAGDKLAAEIRALVPGATFVRSAPKRAKDWNEVLQRGERGYIGGHGWRRRDADRAGQGALGRS